MTIQELKNINGGGNGFLYFAEAMTGYDFNQDGHVGDPDNPPK